jgi:uncharacterized protein YcbX
MTERGTSRITHLITYPVKSMGGVEVDQTTTWTTGLAHDREFVLVRDNDGEAVPITQREVPKLATFAVRLNNFETTITARSGEQFSIAHGQRPEGEPEQVVLFDKAGTAAELSQSASEFVTDTLDMGEPVRLMKTINRRQVKESTRSNDPGAYNVTGYADGYPMLLASESSLDALNARIVEFGGEPVPMNRFRPNVVIDTAYDALGQPGSFAEDYIKRVHIGLQLSLRAVRACSRCVIVTQNQITGEKTGPIVNKALAQIHGGIDVTNGKRGVFFGQNMIHNKAAEWIRVGDEFSSALLAHEPNVRT